MEGGVEEGMSNARPRKSTAFTQDHDSSFPGYVAFH